MFQTFKVLSHSSITSTKAFLPKDLKLFMSSGISTPLSQASTLTNSSELRDSLEKEANQTTLSPSVITEYYASKASSAIFLYDLARDAGFGQTSRDLLNSEDGAGNAVVFDVQTRAGAGLQLLGRLTEGTSIEGSRSSAAITAFTTPSGLAQMTPILPLFEKPTAHSRLILQVPAITHLGNDMIVSPTLSHLSPFFSNIPEHFTVLLSATPQEIIDFATISYSIPKAHVVHIFDHWSAGHEISRKRTPAPPPVFPVLDTHTAVRKAGYDFFEYSGDASAATVLVVLNGPLALSIKSVASVIPSFGVLIVKVLRPWDEKSLRAAIPKTADNVHVLDDVLPGSHVSPLYQDVLGSLVDSTSKGPRVLSQRLESNTLGQLLVSAQSVIGYLSDVLPISWFAAPAIPPRPGKRITFYSTSTSPLHAVPDISSQPFLRNSGINARLNSAADLFSKAEGLTQSTLLLSSVQDTAPIPFKVDQGLETDSLVVLEPSLFTTHNITGNLKDNAPILITTAWTSEELVSNISPVNLENIKSKNLRLLTIDAESVAKGLKEVDIAAAIAVFAFLRLYIGQASDQKLLTNLGISFLGEEIQGVPTHLISAAAWDSLRSASLPSNITESTEESISKEFTFNALSSSSAPASKPTSTAQLGSWIDVAKHIIFREAFAVPKLPSPEPYPADPALRPDVPERTFLVTCTVNRRLTPLEYNRNVFHLEFDTSGTGLKYEIGEALGVHGWNDTQEVLDFCAWYRLDPNKVLQIPVPGDTTKQHVRTVFQAFQQQIDIFGKPPKSFYESLSGYATSREDRMALRFISAAEGSSTFKKLSELDTVTFADVLQKFPSARPPVETLCEIVGDIKPRHYSIASAQSAVGDRVDLLVVTVDWVTPSGSPRFGQCTRYLAGLKIGQKITVSIKPSVMKLPPDNMQPIIMAGLGTGAAPFRAFMQHRALLVSNKIPVGPMLYYFGSRHRSEEYLYGEEIEAFLQGGVITHAGLAFSRDEKKKVYIQHKMLQDGKMLADMLGQKQQQKGVFYLCGPTWPVPDVFEAIVGALWEFEGMERSIAEQYIEDLKEEERYVLEVY